MKKVFSVVATALIAISLWCGPAQSQPFEVALMGPGIIGDGPGMMIPLLLRGIDLTDDQKVRIKDIMKTQRTNLRTLFSQVRTAHEEMADKLLTPGEVKAEDFTPQLQRITQLREQLLRDGLTVMLEVRQILTPEQLAKAAHLKERMQALHEEMRGLVGEGVKNKTEEEDVFFFKYRSE